MTTGSRTWEEEEVQFFTQNPDKIPAYLDIAFEEAETDGDWDAFLLSLKVCMAARLGRESSARLLEGSRGSLLDTLRNEEGARLEVLRPIIHELGLRFSVQPLRGSSSTPE